MPWNEPGSNKKDPWNSRPDNQGPPDLDDLLRKLTGRLSGIFGGGKKGGGAASGNGGSIGGSLILAIIAGIWLASGFYIVTEGQSAVILRFGEYVTEKPPGLRWHLPYPIEKRIIVDVGQVRSVQNSATMLTKDENIVEVEIAVQYRIKDPSAYSFNVRDPDSSDGRVMGTLFRVMESAVREVIGKSKMDFILGAGRSEVAVDTKALMQEVLDEYGAGLEITTVNLQQVQPPEAVQGAFADAIKAREDEVRFKNEAEAYENSILPQARGEASRIQQEASAYQQEVIAKADGEAARFSKLLIEYKLAPEVTRRRLYLDAVESVLSRSSKVVLDVEGGGNLLYLPLDKLMKNSNPDAVPALIPDNSATRSVMPGGDAEDSRVRSERSGRIGR